MRACRVNTLWQDLLSNNPQDTKGLLPNISAPVFRQICQQQEPTSSQSWRLTWLSSLHSSRLRHRRAGHVSDRVCRLGQSARLRCCRETLVSSQRPNPSHRSMLSCLHTSVSVIAIQLCRARCCRVSLVCLQSAELPVHCNQPVCHLSHQYTVLLLVLLCS